MIKQLSSTEELTMILNIINRAEEAGVEINRKLILMDMDVVNSNGCMLDFSRRDAGNLWRRIFKL